MILCSQDCRIRPSCQAIDTMRILAIDPAIRNTGFAGVEGDHKSQSALAFDVISMARTLSQSGASPLFEAA